MTISFIQFLSLSAFRNSLFLLIQSIETSQTPDPEDKSGLFHFVILCASS